MKGFKVYDTEQPELDLDLSNVDDSSWLLVLQFILFMQHHLKDSKLTKGK